MNTAPYIYRNDSSIPEFTVGYRYGFQGQETDSEYLSGAVSFKYRMHDARLGRFLSVDPLWKDYAMWAPYVFSGNLVLMAKEQEGLQPDQSAEEVKKILRIQSRDGYPKAKMETTVYPLLSENKKPIISNRKHKNDNPSWIEEILHNARLKLEKMEAANGTQAYDPEIEGGVGDGEDWGHYGEGEHYSKGKASDAATSNSASKSDKNKSQDTASKSKHKVSYQTRDKYGWYSLSEIIKPIEPGDTVGGGVKDDRTDIKWTRILKTEPVTKE